MRYNAIVIGGGHNGLTAAAYLARAGRTGAGPRAAARRRRRRGHRRSLPRIPLFRLFLRRLPAPARNHPRARPARATACEMLPLDGTFTPIRPGRAAICGASTIMRATRREIARHSARDAERYDEYGKAMVDDGAVRQADPGDDAARSADREPPRSAGGSGALGGTRSRSLPADRAATAASADDDERGGLPRSVVRDRCAEGDDVGVGHHRHVPRRSIAGNRVRAAAPLHGRDRRGVPVVGLRAGRHGRGVAGDRGGGLRGRRARFEPSAPVDADSRQRDGRAIGVVLANGEELDARPRAVDASIRG